MNKQSCIYLEDPRFIRKYDLRLAMILGETAATFIQQVHYHCVWKQEKYGAMEWRASLSEWQRAFPNWSLATIKRTVKECRDLGVLKTRKVVGPRGIMVWYSLDYGKLTEIGGAGEKKLEAELAQNEPEVGEGTAQNEPTPQLKMTLDLAQNEHHLVYQSSKPEESSTIKGSDAGASTVGPPNKEQIAKTIQASVKKANLKAAREKFAEKGNPAALIEIWKNLVTAEFGKKGFMPLSYKDRKVVEVFINWCKECEENPEELLQWCISNWDALRYGSMKWAKLGAIPHLPTILNLRDRFLEQRRAKAVGETQTSKPSKVYTAVDQIPKDHKDYAMLKQMVEQLGRVEMV